jgi:hypothetical protein
MKNARVVGLRERKRCERGLMLMDGWMGMDGLWSGRMMEQSGKRSPSYTMLWRGLEGAIDFEMSTMGTCGKRKTRRGIERLELSHTPMRKQL